MKKFAVPSALNVRIPVRVLVEYVVVAAVAFIAFWLCMGILMSTAQAGPNDWRGGCPGPGWCSNGRGGCVPCRPRPPRRPCC